jgi:hypothetical protein|nr:MAG TPA: hypothetical protein [Microviridae sp.]
MKRLFKWIITIKLEIGTEITTVVTADSIGKACNSMKYTAERLNGEITKIERDEPIEDQEHSSDQ